MVIAGKMIMKQCSPVCLSLEHASTQLIIIKVEIKHNKNKV